MKAAFLLLVLIASLGQANAAGFGTKTVEEIQIEVAIKEASQEVKAAYETCLKETPESNCVNEVLGDIYN